MTAPAALFIVSGSKAGDVDEQFVRRRLDRDLKAARHLGAPLKLVHDGAPGVSAVVATWAAEHGIEARAVAVAEAEFGMLAEAVCRERLIETAERAEAAGWAVRIVIFPGAGAGHAWELWRAARKGGLRTEIHTLERPDEESP